MNHVIKIAKKKYYEEQLIKYKHNTKCLWKTINEIMNKHRNNRILPKEFNGDSSDEIIDDPYKIANKFNEYFVNIGPGLAKKLPDGEITFDKYLTNKNNNNFFIEPVTKHEIEIQNLNSKKSPGYISLPRYNYCSMPNKQPVIWYFS